MSSTGPQANSSSNAVFATGAAVELVCRALDRRPQDFRQELLLRHADLGKAFGQGPDGAVVLLELQPAIAFQPLRHVAAFAQ